MTKPDNLTETILAVINQPDTQAGYPTWAEQQAGLPKKPGVGKATWCNRAANRIAESLGFDPSPFLDKEGIDYTTANEFFNNAVNSARAGIIRELNPEQAQAEANAGGAVFAISFNPKGSGHVATVCPCPFPYCPANGPLVGEAGTYNRITFAALAFEKWGYTPKYFIVPEKDGTP
jgi:hypothetical protein